MSITPNIIAYLALILCVPIALFLFKRYPPPLACALTIIGSAMFLPEQLEFDMPLFPPLDKISIPAIGALLGVLIWARARVARARPFRGIDLVLLAITVGTFVTVFTNGDPIKYENGIMDPLSPYDVIAISIRDFLVVFLLFFLGRSLFTTRRDLYLFTTVMAGAGLLYSLLYMVEVRLSPQLHNWVYGYHQHSFAQTYRFGGYRPMIFMTHGLNASRFMVGTLLCAVALARAKRPIGRFPAGICVVWLCFTVLLSRSAGAWVLATISLLIIYLSSVKMQLRFATLLSLFVLLYPVLRFADQVPIEGVIDWAADNISPERASSLEDRFEQEDLLLEKMRKRPAFGWGPGIRYSIWMEELGEMATIDGEWLHVFGLGGMWRFVCVFGLYLAPVWAARRNIDRLRPDDQKLVAALTVMVAVWAFDNIPNSTGTVPQMFIAGVVYGGTRALADQTTKERRKRLQLAAARAAAQKAPAT